MTKIIQMPQVSTITPEQLLENGWVKSEDSCSPFQKVLTDTEHEDYDPEDGILCLALTNTFQYGLQFGLYVPDGGLVILNPLTIEELNLIEKMIVTYDPPY